MTERDRGWESVTVLLIVRCDGRDGGCMASRTDVLASDKTTAVAHSVTRGWLSTDGREFCPRCKADPAATARTPDLGPVRTGRLAAVTASARTPSPAPAWLTEDPPERCDACTNGDHYRCAGSRRGCACLSTIACGGHL